MSSEASNSSFVMVDVKLQGERSYYSSQLPVDSSDRVVESSSQERLTSHRPTECTSDVITAEVNVTTVELPKVEELANNLMIATGENERYRKAMEDCNKALSKEIEVAECRKQEIENLKASLEDYRVKNTELVENNKSLQEQLSVRVCLYIIVFVVHVICSKAQGVLQPSSDFAKSSRE